MTRRKLSRCLPLLWSFSWCVGPHTTFILYSPTTTHPSWGHPILVISTSPSTGWQCPTLVSILSFITTWTRDLEHTSTKFSSVFQITFLKLLKIIGRYPDQIQKLRSTIFQKNLSMHFCFCSFPSFTRMIATIKQEIIHTELLMKHLQELSMWEIVKHLSYLLILKPVMKGTSPNPSSIIWTIWKATLHSNTDLKSCSKIIKQTLFLLVLQ